MGWARNVRAYLAGGCLVSIGFVLGADLNFAAAATQVKCPSDQAYDATTKECSAALVAGKPVVQSLPKTKVTPPPKGPRLPLPPPPSITSISPPGGGAGTTVTINGTGYAAGATVAVGDAQLGMAQATKITVLSPTQITAVVPPGRSLSANEATTVNVQVTVAGQTSKAAVFSYCSSVTEYSPTQNKCAPLPPTGVSGPPQCAPPLVFNTAENKCVPAAPVVCTSGQIFSTQQNQCISQPPGTFEIVEFVIGTGGDNLAQGSQAWASFTLPTGAPLKCTLHDSNAPTWNNNSSNTVVCLLHDLPMTLSQLRKNNIIISTDGGGSFKTTLSNPVPSGDNWNLQSVTINAYNQGDAANCVFTASGNPLHRFTLTDTIFNMTDLPNGC